jgi:molybdopterin converting factor small subunit
VGTGVVFCFKFRFVSCAVILLSLNGCVFFKRHVGHETLHQVQTVSVNLKAIKEKRNEEDCITGELVRISRNAVEAEKRNDAFDALEERYPEKIPSIDENCPTNEEIAELRSRLLSAEKKINDLLKVSANKIEVAGKNVEKLQEKEVALSQWENIAMIGGVSFLACLIAALLTGRFKT